MKVCIESTQDGKFSVYEEGAEAMGEQTEMSESQNAQPAATIDEALAMAKQMLTGSSEQNSPEQMFEQQAGDAMSAGFKKARGTPVGGY